MTYELPDIREDLWAMRELLQGRYGFSAKDLQDLPAADIQELYIQSLREEA